MDQPNIILIVLDTLRKDVLPMYGGKAYTPNLNEFAKDSVVFPNAIAPAPWTLPSHASFFTGLYPREHGIHEYFNAKTNDFDVYSNFNNKTIVEILNDKGLNTIGFSANGWINISSGFQRGFQYFEQISSDYLDDVHDLNFSKKFVEENMISIKKILKNYYKIPQIYRIYKKNRNLQKYYDYPAVKGANLIVNKIYNFSIAKPFFLFINFVEAHEPHCKWETGLYKKIFYPGLYYIRDLANIKRIPSRIMKDIRKAYVKNLTKLDFYFGELIKYLKEIKEYDNTLIIVTSDHGQALKEKNYYGHGIFLYNEIIEVPLIVKFPDSKKIPIMQGYQSLIDLPDLIKNVLEGNIIDITKKSVFSESYGFQDHLYPILKDYNKIKEMRNLYGNPRKAIYKNNYKLVIGGIEEGSIEEFTYKGRNIDPKDNKEVLEDLLDELEIFKGTEKFVVRK